MPETNVTDRPAGFSRGQIATLVLLTLGYAGYYFCRANFSVAKPLIIEELAAGGGISKDAAKVAIGTVASWGTLAYAFGKFVAGGIADSWGGKRSFLTGMVGAILATLLFLSGGALPIFTLAWILNRSVQSLGWPGLVQVSSRWFSRSTYGAALGVLSLSYLFGDAAARQFHSVLLKAGYSWRAVFVGAAIVLGVVFVANALFLKSEPKTPVAENSPAVNALADEAANDTLASRLKPLLTNPAFWCVCAVSLCVTLARETFNEWTPTYFVEWLNLTKADAASKSALFPLLGGVSVIAAGFASDRLGPRGRTVILCTSLPVAAVLLLALAAVPAGNIAAIWLVSAVGFALIGPYSYLAGALALDFGGKRSGATASGIIDGVGYLAGVLAGERMAKISVVYGWRGAFVTLAVALVFATIAAIAYGKASRGNASAHD